MNLFRKCGVIGILAAGLLTGISSAARAFDTGPHNDLTREVMNQIGMNENAVRTVQLENWLVDYYSNTKTFSEENRQPLENLHFDGLETTENVTHYWDRLTINTKAAVQEAAREKNAMKVLALTGMSLHAVQDFYTHSNWVETHPASGADYNTVTWFDTKQHTGVRTGSYPNSNPVKPTDHGNYDQGINHDSQSRPEFGRAYVHAYAASRQWVAQIQDWVNEVDPEVWKAAQNISLSDDDKKALENGLNAAYRVSLWVTPEGNDGHWKGKGSGYTVNFVAAVASWVAASGGPFVRHFRDDKWHLLLSGGQGSEAQALGKGTIAPAEGDVPEVKHISINKKVVLVRTTEIRELPVKFFETKIDVGGTADFYAYIDIDGMRFVENTYQNRDNVSMPWETIKFVDEDKESIDIRIEVWDEDIPTSGDDHCDICNGPGYDQVLRYNTQTREISGTIRGIFDSDSKVYGEGGNDKDRAYIKGFITTRTLMKPAPEK